MPNVEWSAPHKLTSSLGDLFFNVPEFGTGRIWQLDPSDYKIIPSLRVTSDNLSMTDGSQLHPRWKTGLVANLRVIYAISEGGGVSQVPACGEDLREMHEQLMSHLDALRTSAIGATQRLFWTPTGYGDDRMLDDIQCLAWADPAIDGQFTEVSFALETPFPYAIDNTQTVTHIADGATVTITNIGSSDFKPVVKVFGASTAFVLINSSVLDDGGNQLFLDYDGSRPGASNIGGAQYVEFDFFRGTAFLNGSGADRAAGIVPTTTDFFPLRKGANIITISGAAGGCDVLWNNAWS